MDETPARRASPRIGMSPRIAESIAADLRQRILKSDVSEAPLPRQDDLITRYGVSGPSLREALRILEAEGLITVRRGKFGGAYVHKPSWSSAAYALALSMQGQGITIADLAASLLVLEPMCAAASAARADRAETVLPALQQSLVDTEQLIGTGAPYSAAARPFHDALVLGLENETLRLLVRSLVAIWTIQEQTWADTANASSQYPTEADQRESYRSHVALYKLIEAGDVEGASELSMSHLKATQALVLSRFGDEVVDSSSLAALQAFRRI